MAYDPDLDEVLDPIKERLAANTARLAALAAELPGHADQLASLAAQLPRFADRVASIEAKLPEIAVQVAAVAAVAAELPPVAERVASLEAKLPAYAEKVASVAAQLPPFAERVTAIEAKLPGLADQVAAAAAQLVPVADRLASVEAQLPGLATQVTSLEARLPGFAEQFIAHAEKLAAVTARLDALEAEGPRDPAPEEPPVPPEEPPVLPEDPPVLPEQPPVIPPEEPPVVPYPVDPGVAGFARIGDLKIDRGLSFNWKAFDIYLPTWGVGPKSVGKPSLLDWRPDGSVIVNAERGAPDPKNGNRTWYTGAMQGQNAMRHARGRMGADIHVTGPNAVASFFGYADNGKEVDFELTRVDGVVGWSPAVHMPKTGGGRVSSDRRRLNRAPLADRIQRLEYDLRPDRCDFYCDGVIFETVTPADMAAGGTWDMTTGMAVFFSVENHDAWAGWTAADYDKGAQMRVYAVTPQAVWIPDQATAPSQVTDLAAIVWGSSATLTWTAPADGGSPITDYVIELDGAAV